MLDRKVVKEFHVDFTKAVAQLEKQYGVNITLGTISFSSTELRAKMTARVGERVVKATSSDFRVGDIVTIRHKKVDPTWEHEVIKVNSKNIKVKHLDSGALLNVSSGLLVKK